MVFGFFYHHSYMIEFCQYPIIRFLRFLPYCSIVPSLPFSTGVSVPFSPRVERARHEGFIEGYAETVQEICEKKHVSPQSVLEARELDDEMKQEILELLEK